MNPAKVIKKTIAELFERSRARLLGRQLSKPNRILIQLMKDFGLENTIEGLFRSALASGVTLDADVDESLIEAQAAETGGYIDELEKRTYRSVLDAVKTGDTEAVTKAFTKATSDLEAIVITETNKAQNLAVYDGVMQAANAIGVNDPTLCALGKLDGKTCKYCLQMYHVESNQKKPRAFKSSQILEGWFKPKEWDGKTTYRPSLHPRCRHLLVAILPGFGLDENGTIKYVSKNYDEYEYQKSKGETW